jgi:hypothetical protein
MQKRWYVNKLVWFFGASDMPMITLALFIVVAHQAFATLAVIQPVLVTV